MNKEEIKKLKYVDKLINVNNNMAAKFESTTLSIDYTTNKYLLKINGNILEFDNLNDWYTKEQLKEIKVSSLQAVNLLQNDDFFEIGDLFEGLNGDKIIKQKDRVRIKFNQKYDDVSLSINHKNMVFVPCIKPFTKSDLKSGMIVVNSDDEIGHVILNSTRGDIIQYNCGYIDNLSDYDDNLVKNCDNTEINKIYKLKDNYSFNNYDFNDKIRYELLWSRE